MADEKRKNPVCSRRSSSVDVQPDDPAPGLVTRRFIISLAAGLVTAIVVHIADEYAARTLARALQRR